MATLSCRAILRLCMPAKVSVRGKTRPEGDPKTVHAAKVSVRGKTRPEGRLKIPGLMKRVRKVAGTLACAARFHNGRGPLAQERPGWNPDQTQSRGGWAKSRGQESK